MTTREKLYRELNKEIRFKRQEFFEKTTKDFKNNKINSAQRLGRMEGYFQGVKDYKKLFWLKIKRKKK